MALSSTTPQDKANYLGTKKKVNNRKFFFFFFFSSSSVAERLGFTGDASPPTSVAHGAASQWAKGNDLRLRLTIDQSPIDSPFHQSCLFIRRRFTEWHWKNSRVQNWKFISNSRGSSVLYRASAYSSSFFFKVKKTWQLFYSIPVILGTGRIHRVHYDRSWVPWCQRLLPEIKSHRRPNVILCVCLHALRHCNTSIQFRVLYTSSFIKFFRYINVIIRWKNTCRSPRSCSVTLSRTFGSSSLMKKNFFFFPINISSNATFLQFLCFVFRFIALFGR